MAYSPTSIQTFVTCPKQYEAKYVTKEVKFSETPHTVFGNLIHKSLENYLLHKETLPALLLPMKHVLDRMGSVLVGAETKLAVSKDGKSVSYFSNEAYQRCIVDAILADTGEKLIVCIDWKTGKKRDSRIQHDVIKKCVKAKYPHAHVVTLFLYLFSGQHDRQQYNAAGFTYLDDVMMKIHKAEVEGFYPPKQSGLCRGWCDVTGCSFNQAR